MSPDKTQRKLTAILSADVAGYSRLMGDDEEATIETLTAYREVFLASIEMHRGRVVDAKGDAILAEFPSVVDAVSSAVEIQGVLNDRNAQLTAKRRMDFRIGINLGDVVVKDDAIYGDGVNVAARLEGLAEPGGLCISRPVFDQVKSKLRLEFEFLGEHFVKNIEEPVRAYQLRATPTQDSAPESATESEVAHSQTGPATLAVLPFTNMSGDPEQEYFADGITEDLITDLSKHPGLAVAARNSSFAYKGKNLDMRQVGRELDVNYVLEGSVRKAGNRVRITGQLISATTGKHLWASRYDRDAEDVFAVQNEITEEIVTALNVKLLEGDLQRVWRKYLKTPEGRELYREGSIFFARPSKDSCIRAREIFEQVVILEPSSPAGYNGLGWTHYYDAKYQWVKSHEHALTLARQMAEEALSKDQSYPASRLLLGSTSLLAGDYTEAIAEGGHAERIAPNHAHVNAQFGMILYYSGHPEQAMVKLQRAVSLNPAPPAWYNAHLAMAYYGCEKFTESVRAAEMAIATDGEWMESRVLKTAAHVALGDEKAARAERDAIIQMRPEFSLAEYAATQPYRLREELEQLLQHLRKAGLPE